MDAMSNVVGKGIERALMVKGSGALVVNTATSSPGATVAEEKLAAFTMAAISGWDPVVAGTAAGVTPAFRDVSKEDNSAAAAPVGVTGDPASTCCAHTNGSAAMRYRIFHDV